MATVYGRPRGQALTPVAEYEVSGVIAIRHGVRQHGTSARMVRGAADYAGFFNFKRLVIGCHLHIFSAHPLSQMKNCEL